MDNTTRYGPNPCELCGGEYGDHTEKCLTHLKATILDEKMRECGKRVREALELKDDLALGKAIRDIQVL